MNSLFDINVTRTFYLLVYIFNVFYCTWITSFSFILQDNMNEGESDDDNERQYNGRQNTARMVPSYSLFSCC